MLDRFKSWLVNSRHSLFSWYTKDSQETQEPERSLVKLPQEIREKLVSAVENLPSNPADIEAIVSALDRVFDSWRKDPENSSNSFVVLSSPVTVIARILTETLAKWGKQQQVSLRVLPFTARPTTVESIKSKLEHYLVQKTTAETSDDGQLEVVVIPNLSWCFLRSLDGLEGIEYLQSLLCEGSDRRFWIIGSGLVSWEYLHSVCNLEAYCGEVFTLPEIAPEKLQAWLDPVVEKMDLIFDKPRIDKQLLDSDKDNKTNYFEHLAFISKGDSTVAVQGFLQSICYEESEEEKDQKDIDAEPKSLVAQNPKLPDLPPLAPADRYLLYSLLLHGDLTVSALAESLGDEKSEVQTRVQVLRRKGIIEQQDKVLKINPVHYPKLKQELVSNNFIIYRE